MRMKREVFLVVILMLSLFSFIDALPPSISINYPQNTTYDSNVTSISWSSSISNITNCKYTLNGGVTNNSIDCLDVLLSSNVESNQDSNTWTIFAGDVFGNFYSTSVTFWVDSIYPHLTITSPSNYPLTYTNVTTFTLTSLLTERNIKYFFPTKPIKFLTTDPYGAEDVNYPAIDASNVTSRFYNSIYSGDGNYTYRIITNDSVNHQTTTQGTIVIDTLKPRISITSPSNNSNNSGTIAITATGSDLVSGIRSINLTITNGSYNDLTSCVSSTCNYNWNSRVVSDGAYNINAQAYDNAGNTNSTVIVINVDNTNPQIYFNNPSAGKYNLIQLLNISSYDAHLFKSKIYINGNLNISNSNIENAFTLGEGNYSIYGYAEDTFGNTNQTETRNILIDLTSPVISLIGANPQIIEFGNAYSELGASALDNFDGNVSNNISINSLGVNISAVGSYYVFYLVNDSVNNSAVANRTVNILDTTSPTITLESPRNNKGFESNYSSVEFRFNVSDLSPVSNCSLVVDGASVNLSSNINQSITSSFSSNGFTTGSHNWKIVCIDSYNNERTSSTRFFSILTNAGFGINTNYTELSSETNIENVSDFFVINVFGGINWTTTINFSSGINWSKCLNISENRIEVNSSCFSGFNVSAMIQFYNLTWTTPELLKDNNAVCYLGTCTSSNYSSGRFMTLVSGFSTYSTRERQYCGDSSCNNGEDCSSCSSDCGSCSSGSSGGGGGSVFTQCTTNWNCSSWSECSNNIQTRSCSKLVAICNAGTKPLESQSCGSSSNEESSETENPSETIEEKGFLSTITGAITGRVFGANAKRSIVTITTVVVLLGLIYFAIRHYRKRTFR